MSSVLSSIKLVWMDVLKKMGSLANSAQSRFSLSSHPDNPALAREDSFEPIRGDRI